MREQTRLRNECIDAWIAQGRSQADIAEAFEVSRRTVQRVARRRRARIEMINTTLRAHKRAVLESVMANNSLLQMINKAH